MKPRFKFVLVLILILAVAGRLAAQSDLAAFDQSINTLIERYHIPGATVAVARGGKLVIARAYGLADRERNISTQPDSLFRIASVSKTFTATAILKLIDEGRLELDTKVFPLLDQFHPPPGKQPDPRLQNITIRELLQHSGGWDAEISDPLAMSAAAARTLGVPAPVGPDELIRYVMGQPLNFDPGARFAYSNFGYQVLGRVIEKITGMPYEDYVNSAVLIPIGVRRMRLGKTLLSQRAEGEVVYYDFPGARLTWTQVRGGPPVVPWPYALPLSDACGGWIASAIDLARFALAMDENSGRPLLLEPGTLQQARQDLIPAWTNWMPPGGRRFYGLGWIVDVAADGAETWWHSGGMPGTLSLVLHRADGTVLTALFNSNPIYDPSAGAFGDMVGAGEAYQAFNAAIDSVKAWPEVDLFDSFQ